MATACRPAVGVALGEVHLHAGELGESGEHPEPGPHVTDERAHRWRLLRRVRVPAVPAALRVKGHQVQTGAGLAGDRVLSAHAVLEKPLEEGCRLRIARSGDRRSAQLRLRDDRVQRPLGVVVETAVLVGGTGPVEDVGLVPEFPVPPAHLAKAVAPENVARELANQIGPARVVRRRIGPARVADRLVGHVGRRGGERLRHEADFDEGNAPGIDLRVENAVDDLERVARTAVLVERVGVRGSPLRTSGPVACGEHEMAAHEVRRVAERAELSEQLDSTAGVGVVRLVVTDEAPDPPKRGASVGVYVYGSVDRPHGAPLQSGLVTPSIAAQGGVLQARCAIRNRARIMTGAIRRNFLTIVDAEDRFCYLCGNRREAMDEITDEHQVDRTWRTSTPAA